MKRVYAILDTVSDMILGGLHLFPHDAPAIRFFGDLCGDPQTQLGRHPKDHALVNMGYLTDENQMVGIERVVIITGDAWLATQAPASSEGAEGIRRIG